MTIDEDINLFSPLGGRPPEHVMDEIGVYVNKLNKEMNKERKQQEKEKEADNTRKLLSGLYNEKKMTDYIKNETGRMPAKPIKVVHDESVVGIYQDKITGDVILGQPQPVTAVDQSFSMMGITQLPPDDGEIKAVVDPLVKTIKITATAPPEVQEIPIGLTIIPKGMFNRMRYEVWKYALAHLDKSDKVDFPFNDETVYTVWTCKTLQNWKALISTSLKDGMYYECTYNGDKKVLYFDAYKKFEHQEIKFDDETEERIKQENKVAATSAVKVRSLPRNE